MAWGVLGVMALSVRLVGIRHGEPDLIFHPDVSKQASVARDAYAKIQFRYVNRFKCDTPLALYPYGHSILLAKSLRVLKPVLSWAGLDRTRLRHASRWEWAFLLRISSLFWALAALAAFGRWAWPGAGWGARFLAAGLLAMEPLNAYYSHYGMNDVPLAAFLMLAWLAAAGMENDDARIPWRSLACGWLLGAAFGIKYQAVLGGALPAAAWILAFRRKSPAWRVVTVLAVAAGALAGVWMTCPAIRQPAFFAEHFPEFMAWQANIMGQSYTLAEKTWRNLLLLARFSWRHGYGVLLIPWVVVLARLVRRELPRPVARLTVTGAVFSAAGLAVLICSRDFLRSNDLLMLTPFWIWPAGWMGAGLGPRSARWAVSGMLSALLGVWMVTACLDSLALRRPDTQILARDWCEAHLPPGSRVIFERYTVKARRSDVEGLQVPYLGRLLEAKGSEVATGRYLVVSSLACDRFFDPYTPYYCERVQAAYLGIEASHGRVAEFRDRTMWYAQPHIRIYAPKEAK